MSFHRPQELYRQLSFLSYYFHWGPDDVLSLPHFEREKFCREVSRINRETSGAEKNLFEV
ncbi:MAG: hypothetical protein HFH26_12190 [Clostridiaceae bacterium]|nr:hypothetical protein [Clostridiaceae bacterium]